MVAVLKQGASKKSMRNLLENLFKNRKRKGMDVHKYCGTIKLKKDALAIQKEMRDEWD